VVVAALAGLVARKRRRNNNRVIAQLKKHRAMPAIANVAYDMSEDTYVVGHRLDPQRPVFVHPTYSTAADEEAVYQDGDAPLYAVPLEGSGTAHVVMAIPSDGTGSSMSYTDLSPCFAVPPTGPTAADDEAVYQDGDAPLYAVPLEGSGTAHVVKAVPSDGTGSSMSYTHLNPTYPSFADPPTGLTSGPTLSYDTLATDSAYASATPHYAEQSQQQQPGYYTVEKPQSLQSNTASVFTKPYDTDTVVSPAASVTQLYSIPNEDGTTVVFAEPEQVYSAADGRKYTECRV